MICMIPFDFFNRYSVILKNLGLSDYEIRVFLTLLLSGSLSCKVLSHDSGVPTGKIYQVLSNLESKGFVEVSQEKPKVFRAVEPKKALRRRLRQIEDDFFDLELKTREALQTLQLQYSLKYDEIQGIVSEIFDGSSSSEGKIQESLLKAEDEILFSTGEVLGRLNNQDLYKILLERGVKIRGIVSMPSLRNVEKFDRLSNLGVIIRYTDSQLAKYFVVDDKCASLLVDGHEDQTWVQIHGHILCRVLRGKFMQDWNRATLFRRQPRPYGITAF